MRVLHAVKTAEGATWALRQMRELVSKGADVHVLMPDGPLTRAYRDAGVEVHLIQGLWELAKGLPEVVMRTDPDLVHTHFVNQTLVARATLRDHAVPRVFQVPGPLHLEYEPTRRLDLMTAGHLDFWIGACRWTRDVYLKEARRPQNVGMSFYGTDVESFTGRARSRTPEAVQAPPVIGMVAYFYKPKRHLGQRVGLKGHEDFVDAIRILLDSGHNVRAVVAGDAWGASHGYASRVRGYARQRCGDAVQFVGHVSDVPDLYNSIDVAVHPSHSENHGGAVESLLMGVPTVTTTVGGFPDVVRDGDTGYLVPSKSPSGLATAIEKVLSHPATSLETARRGQSLVKKEFDIRKTAADIHLIYQAILAGEPLSTT